MGDSRANEYMKGRRILEVNPSHPIMRALREKVAADSNSSEAAILTRVIYETALVNSGFALDSPSEFASRYDP